MGCAVRLRVGCTQVRDRERGGGRRQAPGWQLACSRARWFADVPQRHRPLSALVCRCRAGALSPLPRPSVCPATWRVCPSHRPLRSSPSPHNPPTTLAPSHRMHSAAESYAEPRVPGGAPYMSVRARVSTVRVIYMQRFLNEMLEYLAGGWRRGALVCIWELTWGGAAHHLHASAALPRQGAGVPGGWGALALGGLITYTQCWCGSFAGPLASALIHGGSCTCAWQARQSQDAWRAGGR